MTPAWAWTAAATFVLLKLVGAFAPLRVSLQQELEGLDISQHGEALQAVADRLEAYEVGRR